MLSEPFPATLDVRKAAMRKVSVRGVLKPTDLPRLRGMLADDDGSISVEMAFGKDDQDRVVIDLGVEADLVVTCQRCLEAMPHQLSAGNRLALVWSDAQAAALPRDLDPLIADDAQCDLWAVVEEELMLALPAFSYHDTEECRQSLTAYADPPPVEEAGTDAPNPFGVLEQLKPGEK